MKNDARSQGAHKIGQKTCKEHGLSTYTSWLTPHSLHSQLRVGQVCRINRAERLEDTIVCPWWGTTVCRELCFPKSTLFLLGCL